ncbi:MAG: histidine phosphatase family protein [Kofleriaceae bacterium]
MHLFVIRHAIAEDAEPGQDDASRELTEDGTKKMKKAVRGLRELGVTFQRVLSSPWIRAMQTADLLRPLCDERPIATALLITPPRAELLAQIAEVGEDTAVVGHEPWLSELIAWLAFGDTRHGDALELKKGSVTWLEGSAVPGGMSVRAILPPTFLRELA